MLAHQQTVDVEEDKSFVFLLYKPGEENSLNPEDILLRYVRPQMISSACTYKLQWYPTQKMHISSSQFFWISLL